MFYLRAFGNLFLKIALSKL